MSGEAWLKAAAIACAAWLCRAAAAGPEPPFSPIAHSALLTLEAADTAHGVKLRVERSADRRALVVSGLAVSVDGRSERATALGDGSWLVPASAVATRGRHLEVVVSHDGIRELLSGELPAPEARGAAPAGAGPGVAGALHHHQQLAWWVLNITVVLIAAIALSRRFS